MTQGVSNKGGDLLATWVGPVRGVVRDIPAGQVSPDTLYDSSNAIWREGCLKVRPGLTQLGDTVFTGTPTGAFNYTTLSLETEGTFQTDAFQADAFQVTSSVGGGTTLVLGTTRKTYALLGGSWSDKSGDAWTASNLHLARFTSIEIGGVVYVLETNGLDPAQQWNGTDATFIDVLGSPPLFSDWCTAANRVIGIVPPYSVRWSQLSDIGTWPALNFKTLSDTTDKVVAIRNLGTLGFVVYKSQTIWVGVPVGGSDAGAFRFEFRGFYDGPANAQCIVDVDGTHIYMTSQGRIASFDGTQLLWLGDYAYPAIRPIIQSAAMGRAFGVYEPTFREVWFFIPRNEDGSDVKGVLAVNLVSQPPAVFPGEMTSSMSTGIERRLGINDTVLFSDSASPRSYIFEGENDDNVAITGFWQCPLVGMPRLAVHHATGVLAMIDRGEGRGGVTLSLATAQMASSTGGTLGKTTPVDLGTEPVHPNVIPEGVRARWMAPRYDFSTPVQIHYVGSVLYGTKLE